MWACTFGWDRRTDTFTLGQWFHGRVYERRCDLSPDGKHLIYFAMNGRWESETKGSWTAISRAPYLKALTLWIKGDAWNGGGLFVANSRYWLNNGYGHKLLHESDEVKRDPKHEPDSDLGNNECLGVYFPRLLRDGWKHVESKELDSDTDIAVFEKPLNDEWNLRKLAKASSKREAGKGVYFDEHELVRTDGSCTLEFPKWEWADLDDKRLVWAQGGKLFASTLSLKGPASIKELHDFNPYKFKRIKAPY